MQVAPKNCFPQDKKDEYICGAAEAGALKAAARVKGRTLPCPEEMAPNPYSFKHGQVLPHSHYPGMRDYHTGLHFLCRVLYWWQCSVLATGLYSLPLSDPKVIVQGISQGPSMGSGVLLCPPHHTLHHSSRSRVVYNTGLDFG